MNIAQGREHLRRLLAETHRAVAPGRALTPRIDIGPTDCRGRLGQSLGTQLHSLGFDLRLEQPDGAPLLPEIEAHWRRRGFTVDAHRLQDPQPEVLASSDGFTLRALAVPGSGVVHLGGDTPCLPPAPER